MRAAVLHSTDDGKIDIRDDVRPSAPVRDRSGSGSGRRGCATRTSPPATAGCPSRCRRFSVMRRRVT